MKSMLRRYCLLYLGSCIALLFDCSAHSDSLDLLLHEHCGRAFNMQMAAGPADANYRRYAPDRIVDVLHVSLDVTPNFDARSLEGVARMTFSPIAKPLKQLRLDAVDLTVHSVESSDAVQAWQNTDEEILITFAEPVAVEAESTVTIRYRATPKDGLFFRTPEMGYREGDTQLWTQGEPESHRHWFPSHDYPNEKFTTAVRCRVPEGMIALSNGRLLNKRRDESTGLVEFQWLQDKPHVNYLVSLIAGYFESMQDQYEDVPLAFYVPPSEKEQIANSFRDTKNIMSFFEEEIGVDYPWDKYYNVCVIDYMFGGMENTSITTLTVRTLFTDAYENLRSSRGLDAHELAHQWFGDLVTCKDWSHLWLNEGFATYYSLLYDRHLLGEDEFRLGLWRNAQRIFRNEKDVIPIVNRVYEKPMEQFSFRAYPKGGWVLHMLRSELGEDLYRKCVRTYLDRYRHQSVVTENLSGVFEELSGRSLDRFFSQWIYLSGYPELKVAYSWNELAGQAKISVAQTQEINEKRPLFQFPLRVRFIHGDEESDRVVAIREQSEDFYFSLKAAPDIVRFDPDVEVLAKIQFNPPSSMARAQLEYAGDALGRILAVQEIAKKKTDQTVDVLRKVLNQDPFYAVRTEAADALADMRTEEAYAALRDSLDQPDARVRERVVAGIARDISDDAFQALARLARREKNPGILTDVIRALGKYGKASVKEELLGFLKQSSYRNEIADASIRAMRTQEDTGYVEPLAWTIREEERRFDSSGLASALGTLAHLASRLEDRGEARQLLESYLSDPRDSVQRAAVRGLGTLGDPKARGVLEAFAQGDSEDSLTKAAQDALKALDDRTPAPVELRDVRETVGDMREQLSSLEEDLADLKKQLREKWEAAKPSKEDQEAKAP